MPPTFDPPNCRFSVVLLWKPSFGSAKHQFHPAVKTRNREVVPFHLFPQAPLRPLVLVCLISLCPSPPSTPSPPPGHRSAVRCSQTVAGSTGSRPGQRPVLDLLRQHQLLAIPYQRSRNFNICTDRAVAEGRCITQRGCPS